MSPRSVFHAPPVEPNLGLERIVFFSDAVMAIAITLLVIDLKLPELVGTPTAGELIAALRALNPRLISFFISFVVVGIYWSSHHRYFGYIKRYDGRLIALNMLFLLFVALMPFFASLLGQYFYLPLGVAAYAGGVAATGFSISAVWWYATHNRRLVDPGLDQRVIQFRSTIALSIPVIFLLSIPVAFLSPILAAAMWWAAPLVTWVMRRGQEGAAASRIKTRP